MGVVYLPSIYSSPLEGNIDFPISQTLRQWMKFVLIEKQSGDFSRSILKLQE